MEKDPEAVEKVDESEVEILPTEEEKPAKLEAIAPVADWEARYKAEARAHQKAQEKIKAHEAQGMAITGLEAKFSSIEERMDALLTLQAEKPSTEDWTSEGETPKPSRAEQLLEQLRQKSLVEKQKAYQQQVWKEYFQRTEGEINNNLEEGNIAPDDPQRVTLLKAYNEATAKFDGETCERLRKESHQLMVASLKGKKATQEAQTDAEKARRRELLASESGSGGGTLTFKEIQKAYAEGRMSFAEYDKALKKR